MKVANRNNLGKVLKQRSLMLHKCGFCQGTGRVRRYFKFAFITCQVCSGRGTVYVEAPAITCAFCGGTGGELNFYPYALITCAVLAEVKVSLP